MSMSSPYAYMLSPSESLKSSISISPLIVPSDTLMDACAISKPKFADKAGISDNCDRDAP